MASGKKYKKTQQDKIEAERAREQQQERASHRKQIVKTVVYAILCLLLVFSFCFPAVTTLLN